MLHMNDWMRLWGLDPKTGWPVVWQLWWPWVQPFAVTKANIEVTVGAATTATEKVEKPMLKAESIEAMNASVFEPTSGLLVEAEPVAAKAPVKKTLARKRAPKKVSEQAPLDLIAEEETKPVVKKTRAKKKPITVIESVVSEDKKPIEMPTKVEAAPDEPKKLEAPVLEEVPEVTPDDEMVQASVQNTQNVAEKVVSETAAERKPA